MPYVSLESIEDPEKCHVLFSCDDTRLPKQGLRPDENGFLLLPCQIPKIRLRI